VLHGHVGLEAVTRGVVPVVLARLEEDAVVRPDPLNGPALTVAAPDTLASRRSWPMRVRVPGGTRRE